MAEHTPVIWLLTDNKPGHRNQLRGLAGRLKARTGASAYWLSADEHPVALWRALLGSAPHLPETLPHPDLIIAAGSSSHRLLLALRRTAATVVLMKPGFPRSWVSACLIPGHDKVRPGPRTLITEGVINNITPLARITEKRQGLILVGGPSRHFHWDEQALTDQLKELIRQHPDWQWTISGSRRTPETMRTTLARMASPQVRIQDPDRTHEDWLAHQLAASRAVWVTPDSASMVGEAITSGVPTGLFELPPVTGSRVTAGVIRLQSDGYAFSWSERQRLMSETSPQIAASQRPPLWEADRAARWLTETLPRAFVTSTS
ncbi:ELM1/GtrOC1 family putative glycosyltransferase [uncultured Marinobacter sp.]|uniref:mitochondrial fission ELM1 family protein n=1 Tax=uncultured Marinobacter sp. TaxID=187379 RepID=UPI0030DD3C99